MQRTDGSNFTTWGQVHIEGRVMPCLLTGHESLCLEDIQKARGRMRFRLFTFLTRVCIFVLSFYLDSFPRSRAEDVSYPEPERNAVNPNEKTTQLSEKSFTSPATLEQPQHPISSSEGDVSRLELERQLSVLLAAQTGRDQRIARLTDELVLKSTLLEEAEANAAEATKRAGLHADRLLMQTSLVEQRDAELVDLQARFNELVLSASVYLILIFDSQFYST